MEIYQTILLSIFHLYFKEITKSQFFAFSERELQF